MEPTSIALIAAIFGFLLLCGCMKKRRTVETAKPRPPGPRPLPIIGNLHLMGSFPHRTLHELSKKYGPIMSVRLGVVPAVVVSSPEAAELFLKTHDVAFAGRPNSLLAEHALYGAKGVAFSPYGTYWRGLRKLLVVRLLNRGKAEAVGELVMREMTRMVRWIKQAASAGEVVDLSGALEKAFESTSYQMVFGEKRGMTLGLRKSGEELLRLAGNFDVTEFIPFLRPFDPMKKEERMRDASKKFDRVLETMIDDQLGDGNSNISHEDDLTGGILGVLLSMLGDPLGSDGDGMCVERNTVKGILVEILLAGMDTSFTVVEWGMSELIRHPRAMKKLQEELTRVVGLTRMVRVSDFPNLPYLDMVVKETFRVRPPAPLLVPHEATEDTTVAGYFIPKNTRLLVNVWAIGRDTRAWPDKTEEFYPERFENSHVDTEGHDFQLVPFGSGRRVCPGWKIGLSSVKMAISLLVHCFEWELPGGAPLTELDMPEKFGLALQRGNHLMASPSYRLHI